MIPANWLRPVSEELHSFDCPRSASRSIVLALERFDVFRCTILAASHATLVWWFSWRLMVSKPVSREYCKVEVHLRLAVVRSGASGIGHDGGAANGYSMLARLELTGYFTKAS